MRPRALLATEFAPLSHMLMNGFFFNQGLDISVGFDIAVAREVRQDVQRKVRDILFAHDLVGFAGTN